MLKFRQLLGSAAMVAALPAIYDTPVNAQINTCAVQRAGSTLDYLRPIDSWRSIAFSATPSLGFPSQSWAVRISRETSSSEVAKLEVVQFQKEFDCNRWFVIYSWSGEIEASRYSDAEQLIRQVVSDADEAASEEANRSDFGSVDGTNLEVELRTRLWSIRRGQLQNDKIGAELSAAFRNLAVEIVPAEKMPEPNWRFRR